MWCVTNDLPQDIEARGEALVAAAASGDRKMVRRHSDFFVWGRLVDEGIPYWQRAVAAGDPFAHFTLARYRKIRGDRAAAETLYRAAADRDVDCAYGLGVLLGERGDPEAAVWFRRGWEEGRHLDCKIELGKLLAAEGQPGEAARLLMSEVEIGDIAVFRWAKLFESFRETFDEVAAGLDAAEAAGDGDSAAAAVRALIDLDRHFADYPGLKTEAAGLYGRASALSAPARVDHSLFLVESGGEASWPEAVALLVSAHEEGVAEAGYVLGAVHGERGDLAEAERWYGTVAGAGDQDAQWNLAVLLKRQRRYDEAEVWLNRLGPDVEKAVSMLSAITALREAGQVDPGEDLDRLPGLRERAQAGDAAAAYTYGKILRDGAKTAYRYLLRWIEPAAQAGDPDAACDLADLYRALGRPVLRDEWYRKAAEAGHHGACRYMGHLLEHHRDYQEAERWFVRAAGDGSSLHVMLAGKLKVQRGAYAEAEPLLRSVWEDADEDTPQWVEAAGYYGLALARLGRPEEAETPLREAAERWGAEIRPHYDSDDLEALTRMVDPAKELAKVEALLAQRDD
ncbi:sel1 repeat family protein [Streptomyces sp. YC504]|uniref:Sel1 repeat family protein n=1 Tax=Streptomyces mesophilus TaxID=1775132 RepID=A0A6G4XEL2_9ACTN|nr:sel1 repeat family protein [Streptomyces mesophilus]